MIEQGIVSLSCLPMRARAGGRRHAEGCKYAEINIILVFFLLMQIPLGILLF